MGLLFCKHFLPDVATVFTTHATSVGRSIATNNLPLYDYLDDYQGDRMARQLNMISKHSLEKTTAHQADCFTTVSEITARECARLLERKPDVITPNGFEPSLVKKGTAAIRARKESRQWLFRVSEAVFGCELPEDTLLVGISGRYEFRNKGLDVFVDALHQLKSYPAHQRDVVGVIMVPANVSAPRQELLKRLSQPGVEKGPLYYPFLTHWLNNIESDPLVSMIRSRVFRNAAGDKVKVLFIPCYLNGKDGIFNKTYYELLSGFDLTVFPSYYEPWGYTPLESIAFGVPTITTSLSGFGSWVTAQKLGHDLSDGVAVVNRTDHNYTEVVKKIAWSILDFAGKSES
jgi:glycosyltransferase involved in cell wall biosynthesis